MKPAGSVSYQLTLTWMSMCHTHKHTTGIPAPAECIITYFPIHFKGADSFFTFLSLFFCYRIGQLTLAVFGFVGALRILDSVEKELTWAFYGFRRLSFRFVNANRSMCCHIPRFIFLSVEKTSEVRRKFIENYRKIIEKSERMCSACRTQVVVCVKRAFQTEILRSGAFRSHPF